MANQQGTGKHPHKSAAEPYPHTKENQDAPESGRESGQKGGQRQPAKAQPAQGRAQGPAQGKDDLKSREYTDKDGTVHHHTRTSGAMGGKDE